MSETILEEAAKLTSTDRQTSYGHPYDNFTALAEILRWLIKRRYGIEVPIDASFIPVIHMAIKLDREAHSPKRDNLVDMAGYARTAEMVMDRIAKLGIKQDGQKYFTDPGIAVPIANNTDPIFSKDDNIYDAQGQKI